MARAKQRNVSNPAQAAAPPRRLPWKGISVAVVVIGGLGTLVALDPPPPGIEFPDQGNTHIETPSDPHAPYNSSPPSSGPHFGGLANWGVSSEPIPPEVFVHNLEDGGIIFAYDCPDGCEDLKGGLEAYVTEAGGRTLLTPYEGIVDVDGARRRGAAVAWTRVLYFDELDDATRGEIDVFVQVYEGIDNHAGR
jgi:hypothetical protein